MKNTILQQKRKLLLVLLLTIAGMINAFAQEFTVDNLKYYIQDDGSSVLVLGLVDKECPIKLDIPNSIVFNGKTYAVNGIIPYAFDGCANLVSVIIPNTITSIEDGTFSNCSGLISAQIPNSVKNIGNHAFYGCKSLTSIIIPGEVLKIENATFKYFTGLSSVIIPLSVNIHENTFEGCDNLIIKWE